ncbi:MAG: type II toxin-antitoxin system PemK/MazF family toxin [Nitrospira sp.]|nr:type II toxin-antitoxin system PemK/MazF family toxin [Nitrospira sp.]
MEGGIRRGEIWTVVPPRYPKPRPVLVISINALNESDWPEILIVPLTSVPGPLRVCLPEEPEQTGLRTTSYAKCESVGPLYKSRLKKRIGSLPPEAWASIEAGVRRVLGLRL